MNSKTYRIYAQHADEMGREIVAITEIPPSTHAGDDTAAVAVLKCEFAPAAQRYELHYISTAWCDGGHSYPRPELHCASALCEHKNVPDTYDNLGAAVAAMATIAKAAM